MKDANELFDAHQAWAERQASWFCRHYRVPAHDHDDVRNVALMALWEAVRTFDASRGWKFNTLAFHVMRGRMHCFLRRAKRSVRRGLGAKMVPVKAWTRAGRDRGFELVEMRLDAPARLEHLTVSELETLQAQAAGENLREIAKREGLTHQAISIRVKRLAARLAVAELN